MNEAWPGSGRSTAGPMLDQLDRRIVAALQISPRATWGEIGQAVGTTESTARRRGERLIRARAVRITAITGDGGRDRYVLMQFACDLRHVADVGRALAARDDVRFVALVTGPFDVVVEMVIPSSGDLARVLLEQLPTVPGITRTTTETELRNFKTAYDWGYALLGDAAAGLPEWSRDGMRERAPLALDEIDTCLLACLKGDGRASYAEIAKNCGITESMARRRIDHLFTRSGIRPVTLVDPQLLGYDVEVLLWLRVDLARLEDIALALAARREVRYISATSGYSDLVCEVIMRSYDDLYVFMTGILGTLPGIREVDIAAELVTLKRAYVQVE